MAVGLGYLKKRKAIATKKKGGRPKSISMQLTKKEASLIRGRRKEQKGRRLRRKALLGF